MDDRTLNILQRELSEWLEANPPIDGTKFAEGADVVLSTAKNARSENQDRALFVRFSSPRKERSFGLLAVLDGIGGMIDGGRCADICISSLITAMVRVPRTRNRVTIVEALRIANQAVWQRHYGRGGTTFAGVFFEQNKAHSVNIGDSHVYEYRPSRGLVQKSADDRLGIQFSKLKGLENVTLNPELSRRLAQYVGMQGLARPHVVPLDTEFFETPNNYIVLSTDGSRAQHFAGQEVPGGDIDPRNIARILMGTSSATSEPDNATVVCARATALLSKSDRVWSPFEHLRVCSVHGVFNFVFPDVEVRPFPGVARRRERERQKQPEPDKLESAPESERTSSTSVPPAPTSTPAEVEKPDAGDTVKPQVTIRQLTFVPIPDEPTE